MRLRLRLKRASAVPARSGRKPTARSLDPQGTLKADTGPQADPSNGSPEPMRPFRIGQLSLAAALAATTTSGCASSGSAPRTPGATPVTRAQTSAVSPVRAPRLSILSPRAGAHTGVMVTVRVALHDAPSSRGQRFRYVLDQRLTRSGGARLTLRDVAPGRHRLEVRAAGSPPASSTVTFIVRAPKTVPAPAPAEAPAAVSVTPAQSPAPTATAPAPPASTPRSAPTPPPATAPRPAPTTSTPPAGAIPQNGGGDGDGDNSGGPSDGDGNV